MIYVVGGAPRAGKSTVARRFMAETGIPFFLLDYLKMGIARGLPEYGVDPMEGDRKTARRLWPVVKGMALTYYEEKDDILLEGTYFLPKYVAELREVVGDEIRACFMGFADIDAQAKAEEMVKYTGETGDWIGEEHDRPIENVEFLKAFSAQIRDECQTLDLKYIENSTDHWAAVEAAVVYLEEA